MKDLKHLLNKIARDQHFTTAQNQLAKASYDCGLMNDVLNDLAGSGIPGYETRRITAFSEIKTRLFNIKMQIEEICSGFNPSNMGNFIEAILVLIEESLCILSWLGGVQGTVLRASLTALRSLMTHLRKLAHNSGLFGPAKALLCLEAHPIIITIDGLDILEELGIDEGPTTFQVQPTPMVCPTSVVDQVLLGLGELVEPETLDLIGEIMMALATALAAAAVLLATLPAGIAAIAYAAAVLAARQAATAALAALVAAGLITQAQADGLVDDMVDGVEACEIEDPVDPKPIDIGVEQGGCCFEGQSIEVPGGENGCQDIGGTWLDDLTQMGCMDLPQYEK